MKNNYRDDSRERYRRRERKLRSMYRRRIFVVFVLALVLGILLGWIGHSRLAPKPVAALPTPAPVITAEPDPTPWADPEMVEEPEVSLDDWEDMNNWDNADWDEGDELTTDDWGESADWGETDDEDFDFGEEEAQSIDDLFGLEDDYDLTGEEELPFDITDENPFEMEGDPFDFGDEEDPFAGIPEEPVEEDPVAEPAVEPTEEPTAEPTEEPTAEPTEEPTAEPTEEPTAEPTEEPTAEPTEEPTAEPTEEPTAEPTEEPTAEPVPENNVGGRDLPVDLGAEYTFTMQVLSDGTPRTDDAAEYFDVPVTVALTRHMDTQYYVDNYSTSYQLRGDEACCEVKVTIGDCEGLNTFSLQDALPMVLVDAEGNVIPGYQFRNAEIGGETESQVATGSSATVYKRYSATEEVTPVSLLVTYYVDGQMQEAYFSLTKAEEEVAEETPSDETPSDETEPSEETAPEAEPTSDPAGESYTIGSSGEGVKKMQNKLIQLGYLSGVGDGEFGKWTAAAVKQAQKDFGLEVTGVADPAFLQVLYSK